MAVEGTGGCRRLLGVTVAPARIKLGIAVGPAGIMLGNAEVPVRIELGLPVGAAVIKLETAVGWHRVWHRRGTRQDQAGNSQ